jgi:hypothetical protein
VPESRLPNYDLKMFEESLCTDCKIISEDKKKYEVSYFIFIQFNSIFKVHKCVLASRSPVFRAMFQHQMTENTENIIDIVDMKGDVIEKMLRFM